MDSVLLIVAVGLFLGMRHATDADHVVAVTTILSRQGDLRHAALTGLFWGFARLGRRTLHIRLDQPAASA